MGLVWGFLMGAVLVLLLSVDDSSSTIVIAVVAITVCILSAWLEKLCATINAFFGSFLVILMIAFVIADDMDLLPVLLIISLGAAVILAVQAYKHYNFAYILVTAFSGAFMASIGGVGLLSEEEPGEILFRLFFWGDSEILLIIMIATVVLGCIGCSVQKKRLNQMANPELQIVENSETGGEAEEVAEEVVAEEEDAEEPDTKQESNEWKEMLSPYKLLFAAPIVRFVVIEIIYVVLNAMNSYSEFLYKLAYWITTISEAITVGSLVYVVCTKNKKFNMIYQIPYLIGGVLFEIQYFEFYSGTAIFVSIFRFAITTLALYGVGKLIKKKEIKPLILVATAFVMYYWILNWLYYTYIYVPFHSGIIVSMIACVIGGYMTFKKYEGINIFNWSKGAAPAVAVPSSTVQSNVKAMYQCVQCKKIYPTKANFCNQCGNAVQMICGNCGNDISADDRFCDKCGNQLV